MGVASSRGPSPLQNATDIQFNVATMTGHWQLVLDLINARIEPGLSQKIWHEIQIRLPLGHPVSQEQNRFSWHCIFYGIDIVDRRQ